MLIRDMVPDDLEAVERLEVISFSEPWSLEAFASGMRVPVQRSIVAEEDGRIAGYAIMLYVPDEGELVNIAVDPQMRRQGIAERMIGELIGIGVSRGASRFTLEVREHNLPARSLYTKLGFTEVGKRKDYYSSPTEDAILMDKVL